MRLSTKANNLKNIRPKYNLVPNFITVNYDEFLKKKSFYLTKIKNKFNNKIIIRSSYSEEDSLKTSNAGKYLSISNVNPKSKHEVERAILKVFDSYGKKTFGEELIVQEMVKNVLYSGVALSADKDNFSPYYIINYSKSRRTDLVTSGRNKVNTFIYFKDSPFAPKNTFLKKIINLISKLTKITRNKFLDIEFAFDEKGKLHLLQLRPIVRNIKPKNFNFLPVALNKLYKKLHKLNKKIPGLDGEETYFSVMADWNPAEIIGLKPSPLALSLYKNLITDNIWAKSRYLCGYKKLDDLNLMHSFFGIPFIDLRIDFNSWLPFKNQTSTTKKILKYYLNKFKKNPHLSDKIEFEIIISHFNFDTKNVIKKNFNFLNSNEKKIFIKQLKEITNKSFKMIPEIERQNEILINKFEKIKKSKMYAIEKIFYILNVCKNYGTLNFSNAARLGFVSLEFINSLKNKNIISSKERGLFLNSIKTIASNIQSDLFNLNRKKFLKKYGHLRPNTYDINSKSYKENFAKYFDKNNRKLIANKSISFHFTKKQKNKINLLLEKNSLKISTDNFIDFLIKAIKLRESIKLHFTKLIDYTFEQILILAKRSKITRQDASYLNIETIINLHNSFENQDIKEIFLKDIKKNKHNFKLNNTVKLPDTIISPRDIYFFHLGDVKVNYITDKQITANTSTLNLIKKNYLQKKIILIENADPGYDYLFTKNIGGLITKYGGVNSHMSVRCSELGIPAAIGVGEKIFDNLAKSKRIKLNCLNQKIDIIK